MSKLFLEIFKIIFIFSKLIYAKQSKATTKGCTVDLLTDKKASITFKTGLENKGGLAGCVTEDINRNMQVF